jgi:cullin 1
MKSRKKMTYAKLVTETILQTRAAFIPTSADVKKYIEILLEKEFLERLEDDFIGYLA